VVATAGSVGALVGITVGIALNAPASDATTGADAPSTQAPPTTTGPGRTDEGWALPDDDWWERGDEGSDDGWRAPAPQQVPQQQNPQSRDGGWSSPQQQAPQTRSAGS